MPTTNPYPVSVQAAFDGNNQAYFLYTSPQGQNMRSPLIIPNAQPVYDSIAFTQTGDTSVLQLWAAVTRTLDNSSPNPQGGNLLMALRGSVTIPVAPQSQRGSILVFAQIGSDGEVVSLVPTPDPTSQNDG